MSLNKQKILNISLTTNLKKEILEYLRNGLKKGTKSDQKTIVLVTPNPEQVVLAQKNSRFRDLLNQADVAIPDGIGLVWAYRFLGCTPRVERITGVRFMEDLIGLASEENVTVGLIGGWEHVAVDALECLQQKYPGVIGWGMDGPEIPKDTNESYYGSIAQKIHETKTQIVFVGLGAPKQEYFIENVKAHMTNAKHPVLFMVVGGAFDEISGRIKMPPKFIERYGLKWLWRLVLEPWRWRRQLALAEFLWLVLATYLKSRLSLER